jgi:hypothetical protein
LPINGYGQTSGASTALGIIDYQDLSGTSVSNGSALGGSDSQPWAFRYPDDASFIIRGQIWAEPHPPAPGVEGRTHLEAGQALRWYVAEDVPNGVIEIATDPAFTSTIAGDSGVVVAKEATSVGRRLFAATNVVPTNSLSYREGEAPEEVAGSDVLGWTVGLTFTSDRPGKIRGVYYYRGAGEAAMPTDRPNVGLFSPSSGTPLATATDDPAGARGWRYAAFATPYPVTPNQPLVVARLVPPGGFYESTPGAFLYGAFDRAPLHVPQYATGLVVGNSLSLPNDPTFSAPNCSVTSGMHLCGRNYFVDVDFVDAAEFSRTPSAATNGSQTYYWRVRNRFTQPAPSNATVNGTLVTSGGSFVPTTGPTIGGPLQFTTGPDATLATVEICTDSSAPTSYCRQPLLQRSQTLAVTGNTPYMYDLATIGSYYWRVTQQYPTGIGMASAWQGPTVVYPLNVSFGGSGTGMVAGPDMFACFTSNGTCNTGGVESRSITLNAGADTGSTFIGWTGCDSTADTHCTISMTGAKAVTANFSSP